MSNRLGLWAIGIAVVLMAEGARANNRVSKLDPPVAAEYRLDKTTISRVRDLSEPFTTVKDAIAQGETATVQVTSVRLNSTDTGLEIILETFEGKPLQVDASKFRTEGNSSIADIPNALLALPQGQTFVADNPKADITSVQVQQQGGGIRVRVTGKSTLRQTEVTLKAGGSIYSLNPEANEPELEINIVGLSNRRGYKLPNASTATKTDTPIRDIPASIQVIPRQVLEDQKTQRLQDVLENSGIRKEGNYGGTDAGGYVIRGFAQEGNFRNGFSDSDFYSSVGIANKAGTKSVAACPGETNRVRRVPLL
jgi:iron complex outermembrane recepter protein